MKGKTLQLFSDASQPAVEDLAAPDATLRLYRGWLAPKDATAAFTLLDADLAWEQERLLMFGRRVPVPRTVAWYGDAGVRYRYSGTDHDALPWHPQLAALRQRLQTELGGRFNSVLANRYVDGSQSMGWHSDDEAELGSEPLIASISLGGTRRFRLRRKDRRHAPIALDLGDGDLLVMAGTTQQHWQHCLTRTRRPVAPRINLTYRLVAGTA